MGDVMTGRAGTGEEAFSGAAVGGRAGGTLSCIQEEACSPGLGT